jgi:copper chaperone CopZ
MKKTFAAVLAAGLFAAAPLALACPGEGEAKAPHQQQQALVSATFAVTGLKDANAAKLKAALLKTEGVAKVDVQVTAKRVIVAFDKAKLSAEQVAKIISELGYPAQAEV